MARLWRPISIGSSRADRPSVFHHVALRIRPAVEVEKWLGRCNQVGLERGQVRIYRTCVSNISHSCYKIVGRVVQPVLTDDGIAMLLKRWVAA